MRPCPRATTSSGRRSRIKRVTRRRHDGSRGPRRDRPHKPDAGGSLPDDRWLRRGAAGWRAGCPGCGGDRRDEAQRGGGARSSRKKCKRPKRTRSGKVCEKRCPKARHSGARARTERAVRKTAATTGTSRRQRARRSPVPRSWCSRDRAMAGGEYVATGTVRTDGAGHVHLQRPTRTRHGRWTSAIPGRQRTSTADDQVTLRVPAAATIRASRHTVRNGRRVRFTGKLRGRPYPPKGKVLDLQAFYRHKWRTFATPRAARRGRWMYHYRFQATRRDRALQVPGPGARDVGLPV